MWPRRSKLAAWLALPWLAGCLSTTGAAGEAPYALEHVGGKTYLVTARKQVADAGGAKLWFTFGPIGRGHPEPQRFDAPYAETFPDAVAGIARVNGRVSAFVVTRAEGNPLSIERLELDGSRRRWTLAVDRDLPDAYRVAVTAPADGSFVWLYFGQADWSPGRGQYRPLIHLDDDGARVVDTDVVWAGCGKTCRYLVDDAGTLVPKTAGGEAGAGWPGELRYGLRAVCGGDTLVTERNRYTFGATAVTVRRLPPVVSDFLDQHAEYPGRLACRGDLDDWLWLSEGDGAFAVGATRDTVRKLFDWPEGTVQRLAALYGDGRAAVAYDYYEGNELVTCDTQGRPGAEYCVADYGMYSTAVSTAALRPRR